MLYQMVLVFQVMKQKLGKVACRPRGLIRWPRRNDSLALQAITRFHRPNWSLPLHYTSMKSLKILKNQSPRARWCFFFIYRLDPRDNHKRKWKPTMGLSQCLTLITIANFSSRGTSRREHSELGSALSYISNYFVQAPYGDVQCHFGRWSQVFTRTFCKVLK